MSDTLTGTLIGTLGTVLVATITWLATRGKAQTDGVATRAQLAEQGRQSDIATIINTLQEDAASLRTDVTALRVVAKAHEETINALRLENYDLRGERAQLSNEVSRLRARVAELEGKVS